MCVAAKWKNIKTGLLVYNSGMKKITGCLIALLIFFGCSQKQTITNNSLTQSTMQIKSSAFSHNEKIPAKYTCDGDDINPPLQFLDVPTETQSLVLISDDPDAPMGTWVHWIVWNIDPKITEIAQNSVPAGAVEGTTSFGKTSYGGPCPPSGVHRYFFKLYALDTVLDLPTSTTATDLEKTIGGHVLQSAELIGLYSR